MDRTTGPTSRAVRLEPNLERMQPRTGSADHRQTFAANAVADQPIQLRPWLQAVSPDEAGRLCGDAFHPHEVTSLGSWRGFTYRQRPARVGSVTVGDFSYGTDVRLEFDEARTGYDIVIPVAGRLEVRHQGTELTADRAAAAVSRPTGEKTVVRWLGGSRILAVKIDQAAVDTAIERLIGRRPDAPLTLGPTLPLTDAAARRWMRLLAAVEQLDESDTPAWRSLVSDPLVESLIHGFLLLTEHPYRQAMLAPVPAGKPPVVRLAVEIIKAGPDLPLTVSALAAQCHVSVRTLQAGFQRDLGISPMAYLREERLRRAHADLSSSNPLSTSVATIAHRWGFSHLGRFSAAHKAHYGQTPVQALHARVTRKAESGLRST